MLNCILLAIITRSHMLDAIATDILSPLSLAPSALYLCCRVALTRPPLNQITIGKKQLSPKAKAFDFISNGFSLSSRIAGASAETISTRSQKSNPQNILWIFTPLQVQGATAESKRIWW